MLAVLVLEVLTGARCAEGCWRGLEVLRAGGARVLEVLSGR